MEYLNTYAVLYIDDNCRDYLPSLEVAAKPASTEIYAVDNVLEGLDFLNEYVESIDAVLLDLSFPKGEIQGIEALQKIKATYSYLPVILLTDSDSSGDIDKVVECMKKGAYNYVGKRTLNPVYLFQVIGAAIRECRLKEQLKIKNNLTDKTERFFTAKDKHNYGRFKCRGIFGFDLKSVNSYGNPRKIDLLTTNAVTWHENLLKTISKIYRDEVQLNLKYIAEKFKIQCRLTFTVYATDKIELDTLLSSIHKDIVPFFFNNPNSKNHPYLFEEITDREWLLTSNDIEENFKYNIFFRKPLKPEFNGTIGFNKTIVPKSDEITGYHPDELFRLPVKLDFDHELFLALCNQNEYTEIDVQLMPKYLMKEEIEFIRQIIKKPASLYPEINAEETAAFISYLQKFITTTNDKFMISVMLKRKSRNWEQHLKTALQDYFFGSQTVVHHEIRKSNKLMRFKTMVDGANNQLPFFYSLYDALQAFRLPVVQEYELPGIKHQDTVFHYSPENLPEYGILMGRKKTVNNDIEIRISPQSLERHLYIMGQTGTGKSTMLKTMISDCLDKNMGFTLVDPHGDLFDDIIKLIPKSKKNKLKILDTTDIGHSVTLNPLYYNDNFPQSKSLVINELIRTFAGLYDMKVSGGPMFETYFKNGLLLLMDSGVQKKNGTGALSDVIKIFQNNDFRNKLLNECLTETVKDFFKTALATSGDQAFANFALYVTSKLTRFVEDAFLSPILTGKGKNIDFRKLMDEENILLVKMDKGFIGSDNTSLLGRIILSNLFLAGLSRSDMPRDQRKTHTIFIDEFQNFVQGDAGIALSEVRKYGLNMVFANQTLGQLTDELLQGLLGNVGSMVFFRPGINDYPKIQHYLEAEFKREDVLKLPNFNCIGRMLIDNIPTEPFVFQTILE